MSDPTSGSSKTPRSLPSLSSKIASRSVLALAFVLPLFLGGCAKPSMPSVTGTNMFHDVGQVRKGMSPNEVRRVMGGNYKSVYEEGIKGMDGGNYTWVYPEGKVYFGIDGVTHVDAAN